MNYQKPPVQNPYTVNRSYQEQFARIKILHTVLLFSVPLALALAFLLPQIGISPLIENDDPVIFRIETIIAFFAIADLVLGMFWLRITEKYQSIAGTNTSLAGRCAVRAVLIASVAWQGVVLSIIGGDWPVWTIMMALSGTMLLLTYPTDERIAEWKQGAI